MVHVAIRPATAMDAAVVHRWRSEPSTRVFQPTLDLSIDQVRTMLAGREPRELTPETWGKLQWLITADGEPVGWITLEISDAARRHNNGVVGYTIGEAHRGRGYAVKGLAALLPVAFDPAGLALERLEAIAATANVASRRVLERNGFLQEGVLRRLLIVNGERLDHAIYGLLRTDWERA